MVGGASLSRSVIFISVVLWTAGSTASVETATFRAGGSTLKVELLDDNLAHFELAHGDGGGGAPIAVSPMVARTVYPGPHHYRREGTALETEGLRIVVDPQTLCLAALQEPAGRALTRLCPAPGGLTATKESSRDLYGLGQQYLDPGVSEGNWMGRRRDPGDGFGNQMVAFNGGANGNTQIPILYALGEGKSAYALFIDEVRKLSWDFTGDPWRVHTSGAPLRFFLFTGRDLRALRKAYLELVGRPPVPPKKAFGLWVSEYGYRDWAEMEDKLAGLRAHRFPVDGFMLDLFWYGGVSRDERVSQMGAFRWDPARFPAARDRLARLRAAQGVGVMPIEEPFVDTAVAAHSDLEKRGFLVKDASGAAAFLGDHTWWGRGGMMDWSNPEGADYRHRTMRLPLVEDGVFGHWLDLGEPENYSRDGIYAGGRPEVDVHNLYNFYWAQGVARGYRRYSPAIRPFLLCRSGAAGIQRFGAAMWSGDIGSDLASLDTHFNAQAQMSLSGIDYYGTDLGGFHREALKGDLNEMYTQWFAQGMLFDVPGRPHTDNLCKCRETSPDRIGDLESNLANLRQRYALIPYVYSLAHRAHLEGEPVFPPPLYYFQEDPHLRKITNEKMIGASLLAAAVARHGQKTADLYLPAGRWIELHSDQQVLSEGSTVHDLDLYPGGRYRLPIFARAGAIIPMAVIDEKTMNALGQRLDGSREDTLLLRIYADREASRFTLYEDDGESTAYLGGAVRTTVISQVLEGDAIALTIGAARGDYAGSRSERPTRVELVAGQGEADGVSLNGTYLERFADEAAWEEASAGWMAKGARIRIKTGVQPVAEEKKIRVQLSGR